MKKFFLALVLSCLGIAIVFAQVPERVQVTFKEKYPDVKVIKWDADGDNYKVWYIDKTQAQNAVVFDKDSRIIRREMEIQEASAYPGPVVDYYTQMYPAEKNYKVWVVTDEAGNKTWYIPSRDRILYFDKDGKFTREQKVEIKQDINENN